MFEHHRNTNKTFMPFGVTPKPSFLSTAHKFGHRSLSASSLPRQNYVKPQQGSLR